MKIAIVVHGRFHAFDLARESIHRGHDVTLFTSCPAFWAQRFGVPRKNVRSLAVHGLLNRGVGNGPWEPFFNRWFGQWAARETARGKWDFIHSWSGVSEEIIAAERPRGIRVSLVRGSSHIRFQRAILDEETRRVQRNLEKPGQWIMEREEREYAQADKIVVLSTFARRSFIDKGFSPEKLFLLPLGADLHSFRPDPAVIQARRKRLMSGNPLRILYVGALSFRKGFWDLLQLASGLEPNVGALRVVGPIAREVRPLLSQLAARADVIGPRLQSDLPQQYAWADVFVFPTLEDGYAMVLDQARAGGLPILTTPHCAGPDFIEEGRNGWILPIRNASSFLERLRWCDNHRLELAQMAQNAYDRFQPRGWSHVAADFERIFS